MAHTCSDELWSRTTAVIKGDTGSLDYAIWLK